MPADEAVVKGDLDAARKSGDPRKAEEAEKLLEQKAEAARNEPGLAATPVQVSPQFADLNEQQRRTIYETVTRQQQPVPAADVGAVEVGAVLPPTIEIHALPGDVTGQIPGTSTFRYVRSGDHLLLVEPTERIVVGALSR